MNQTIVFPGQGAQQVGMGRELFARFPRETTQASEILGYDIAELCVSDPAGNLSRTQYTQPALFVVNALSYLDAGSPAADYFAGHSLGEFNALWAAGAVDFASGVRMVQRRGALMSGVSGGGMAAVIGLSPAEVGRHIDRERLDVANYNSYEQTVISGPVAAIDEATPALLDAGAQRVVPLNVSAPFHSRYMRETEEAFAEFLREIPFAAPHTPVIANASALPYAAERIAETLVRQITGSVRWIESVEYLLRCGERQFVEIGPGNVLTRLVRNIREQTAFAN